MEYFVYCRDNPGAAELRERILEAHWTFMDGYADGMIARGPTMDDARMVATGSLHLVDLPDADAARRFAFEEPNYRAGVYREVLIRRWRNGLGRTMWEFTGARDGYQRFLVIGHGRAGVARRHAELRDAHRRYFVEGGYEDRFIARGALLSDDGTAWAGSAMLVELPDRGAVDTMLAGEPFARGELFSEIEVHRWQFGGRS
ncbi:MAG: YciI family protein [Labedaea sp.]